MLLRPGTFHTQTSLVAQRACVVALRRRGWLTEMGINRVAAYDVAHDVRLYAADWRELLNKCAEAEATWRDEANKKATPIAVDVEV